MVLVDQLYALAETVTNGPVGTAVAESSWIFPILEVLHIIGITVVLGTIATVDLRLMNWTSRHRAISTLTDETLPFTYVGFAVAIVTGLLMFTSDGPGYLDNVAFRYKMLILVIAGINIALFHKLTYRRVDDWDRDCQPPAKVKAAGAVSLVSWLAILLFGRWIAFV